MKYSKSIIKIAIGSAAMFAIFTLSNCKKDKTDEEENDTTTPVVTLTAPNDMQMYNSGDTVFIKGSATDNEMHEMLIELKDDSTNAVLFTKAPTVHDLSSYNINEAWKSSVSKHTNATLTVTVSDHASHEAKVTRKIHIMP